MLELACGSSSGYIKIMYWTMYQSHWSVTEYTGKSLRLVSFDKLRTRNASVRLPFDWDDLERFAELACPNQ